MGALAALRVRPCFLSFPRAPLYFRPLLACIYISSNPIFHSVVRPGDLAPFWRLCARIRALRGYHLTCARKPPKNGGSDFHVDETRQKGCAENGQFGPIFDRT
jgi:hypothetical protein